jgi:AMP nucleosidase
METATYYMASFANHMPHASVLLCSDMPMTPEGVKTSKGDKQTNGQFAELHLKIGLETLREIKSQGTSVRHWEP